MIYLHQTNTSVPMKRNEVPVGAVFNCQTRRFAAIGVYGERRYSVNIDTKALGGTDVASEYAVTVIGEWHFDSLEIFNEVTVEYVTSGICLPGSLIATQEYKAGDGSCALLAVFGRCDDGRTVAFNVSMQQPVILTAETIVALVGRYTIVCNIVRS